MAPHGAAPAANSAPNRKPFRSPVQNLPPTSAALRLLGAILLPAFVLAYLAQDLAPEHYRALLSENQGIEALTASGFLAAALFLAASVRLARDWHGPLLLLACCLRELEMHKRFTTMSLLKSRFYLGDTVPMGEKLVGLAILALLAFAACTLLWRYGRTAWNGLWQGLAVETRVLSAAFLLVFSQSIDGIDRKLRPLMSFTRDEVRLLGAFEEIIELAIPLLIIWAVLALRRRGEHAARPVVAPAARRGADETPPPPVKRTTATGPSSPGSVAR